STAGLTEQDLDELRRSLADGKRPRVRLSGPHFPVGAAGTVVRIGTPESDGADFVRVRVKVNGMTDELAFAPGELSLRQAGGRVAKADGRAGKAPAKTTSRPARAATRASTASLAAADQPPSAGRSAAADGEPARSEPAGSEPTGSQAAGSGPARGEAAKATPVRRKPAGPSVARQQPAKATAAGGPAPAGVREPVKPAGRRRKPAAVKVAFTISSSGASWTLSATRGNKSLVRTVALPPGVVTAVSELLDQPALSESVSEINDAALSEARMRAEQLRAELDQLEAVLATHRRP
ncbi:MAG TPA: hypothetical protein VFU36_00730, partial [Jatrophihabitans sp.]|nr:hypothetical protein [Jatrophihabitans sp.]